MSNNRKLNDLQLILLATAVQRDDGSLLPPPANLGDQGERILKAIPLLLRRALVEEVPVTDPAHAWRQEGEQGIGLVITSAGRQVIAAEEEEVDNAAGRPASNSAVVGAAGGDAVTTPSTPRAGSKIEAVIALLRRDEGATLAALTESTGWLPHTTRAALTGLRKKGHNIVKSTRDGTTIYQIAQSA